MTPALTKTRSVLDLKDATDWAAIYSPGEDSVERPVVIIHPQTYEEMGKPSQITVTIRPGDDLN